MQTVFVHLFEADEKAKEMVVKAQAYYDQALEQINAEKDRITEEYTLRSKKHLEDARHNETAAVNDALAAIDEQYSQRLERLGSLYERQHDRWESELYGRCIGR